MSEKGKINYVLQNYFQPVVGNLQQNAHIYVDFLVRKKNDKQTNSNNKRATDLPSPRVLLRLCE